MIDFFPALRRQFICSLFILLIFPLINGSSAYLQAHQHSIVEGFTIFYKEPMGTPKGVILLFHGCNHDPQDWFQLPGECIFVNAALRAGLVALAVPSRDRKGSRCWHPLKDAERVVALGRIFVRKRWPNVPLYGAGASSGGTFVAWLSNTGGVNFSAVAVYVSIGVPPFEDISRKHAPTAFVVMSEDSHMASEAHIAIQQRRLLQHGTNSTVFVCTPKLITVSWIRQMYPPWTLKYSAALVHHLQKLNVIDYQGALLVDPRSKEDVWMRATEEAELDTDTFQSAAPASEVLRELLNIAWAEHEMTGEYASKVVAFLTMPHSLLKGHPGTAAGAHSRVIRLNG